jgi:hypothetical protein
MHTQARGAPKPQRRRRAQRAALTGRGRGRPRRRRRRGRRRRGAGRRVAGEQRGGHLAHVGVVGVAGLRVPAVLERHIYGVVHRVVVHAGQLLGRRVAHVDVVRELALRDDAVEAALRGGHGLAPAPVRVGAVAGGLRHAAVVLHVGVAVVDAGAADANPVVVGRQRAAGVQVALHVKLLQRRVVLDQPAVHGGAVGGGLCKAGRRLDQGVAVGGGAVAVEGGVVHGRAVGRRRGRWRAGRVERRRGRRRRRVAGQGGRVVLANEVGRGGAGVGGPAILQVACAGLVVAGGALLQPAAVAKVGVVLEVAPVDNAVVAAGWAGGTGSGAASWRLAQELQRAVVTSYVGATGSSLGGNGLLCRAGPLTPG